MVPPRRRECGTGSRTKVLGKKTIKFEGRYGETVRRFGQDETADTQAAVRDPTPAPASKRWRGRIVGKGPGILRLEIKEGKQCEC